MSYLATGGIFTGNCVYGGSEQDQLAYKNCLASPADEQAACKKLAGAEAAWRFEKCQRTNIFVYGGAAAAGLLLLLLVLR